VASNKQQIQWEEVEKRTAKLETGQLQSGCGFVQTQAQPLLSRDSEE